MSSDAPGSRADGTRFSRFTESSDISGISAYGVPDRDTDRYGSTSLGLLRTKPCPFMGLVLGYFSDQPPSSEQMIFPYVGTRTIPEETRTIPDRRTPNDPRMDQNGYMAL